MRREERPFIVAALILEGHPDFLGHVDGSSVVTVDEADEAS